MGDIKLFNIKPSVRAIELKPAKLEKGVQQLIEANMEAFFGIRFLQTEYVLSLIHI